MTRQRASTGEWCFHFDDFKALGFEKACKALGLPTDPLPAPKHKQRRRRRGKR